MHQTIIPPCGRQLHKLTKMKPEPALKNALLEIISCILSPNAEDRRIAEERKKALEVTDEYPIHLLDILLTREEAVEERQMAAILLGQYVRSHWVDIEEDGFVPPKVGDHVKEKIRSILPLGLNEELVKIQNHVAYILATVASYDYPDVWPSMTDAIFSRLVENSNNPLGVMSFIKEFSRLASNCQINSTAEHVYAILFAVAGEVTKYSSKVRAEAVCSLCTFLYVHSSDHKEKQKIISSNTAIKFCELLAGQLVLPHPEQSDYELKSQILMFYSMLLMQMPEAITSTIMNSLPNIWQILSRCGEVYEQVLASEMPPYRDPTENLQEPPRFYVLTFHVFDVLHTLIETHQAKYALSGVLTDVVYYLILFMGISKEVELMWRNDPDVFINEGLNSDCYADSSVRGLTKELLVTIMTELETEQVLNAFSHAIDKHLALCKEKSESYYWRVMEAVMYAVGSVHNFVTRLYKHEQLNGFKIIQYLSQWAGEIGPSPSWLMSARIMITGGQYSLLLHADNISTYVMAIIHNLRESSFILRFSAIRALSLHLETMPQSNFQSVYMELKDPIAHALIYALEQSQGDILHVGLRALESLLKLQPPMNESILNDIITLVLHLISQNLALPEVITNLHSIVKHLYQISICQKSLEARFLPVVANVINNTTYSEHCTYEGHSCALELLTTIVKHSPTPLSNDLIRCFFSVCGCTVSIEDPIIKQYGATCLRMYLSKASSQIITTADAEGYTGNVYILNTLKHFLDPNRMEYFNKSVGRLCATAIQTLGTNLDHDIGGLLKDMLSTMQRSTHINMEESLIGVFASLFYLHMDTVIYYLTLIPGPNGESALTYVLNRWLIRCKYFCGRFFCNLNILALTKLIEHTILKHDQRVADIKVRGDPILQLYFEISSIPPQAKQQFTEIPVLVKIVKFLLGVLYKDLQEVASFPSAYGNDQDDGYIDDFEDFYESGSYQDFSDSENQVSDSDMDAHDDGNPIASMKTSDFLLNFMKHLADSGYFNKYRQYFDDNDKKTLMKIGIGI